MAGYDNSNNRLGPQVDAALERALALTDSGVKIAYENNANTNAFTDAEKLTVSSFSPMTDAEVKIAYENNANTNAFTDAEKSSVSSLSAFISIATLDSSSAHVLSDSDSGKAIVFNAAGLGGLGVPDGLTIGHNVVINNIGAGGAGITMAGSETMQGTATLQNVSGVMSLYKVSSTIWQSSERV